jgi:hypothetical protein
MLCSEWSESEEQGICIIDGGNIHWILIKKQETQPYASKAGATRKEKKSSCRASNQPYLAKIGVN